MAHDDGDPAHPIIDRPWEYQILEFRYRVDPEDWRHSAIDLTLRKGRTVRRLRFLAPQGLAIEGDGCFPQPTGGMCILDVRHRQFDGIGVRVADFEATRAITFWAREVLDLDAETPSS